jgi:hypothetical protein
MATSALPRGDHASPRAVPVRAAASAAYGLGAVALAAEGAVHVQQFVSVLDGVRWIGPLFIANAVAIVVVLAGLAAARTRIVAALAGIGISAVALGSLVISYGTGLLGWQEAGWRTPIAIAVAAEVAAVLLLAAGLAASATERR